MISAVVPDNELIQSVREGNQEAFREIVNRYEALVASTVIGMLGNGQDAEDVGQEVFIRFYKSIKQFRGDSSLGTYLTRIAINLSLNALKKQKRKKIFNFFSSSNEQPELNIPDTGITQEQRETQALVQKALLQLDEDFRSVIVLRMLDGYSTKETAEILELPLGTVLSRLSRAQKKLKDILKVSYGYS